MTSRSVVISIAAVLAGAATAIGLVLITTVPTHRPKESTGVIAADLVQQWSRWRRVAVSFTETTTRRKGVRELVSSVEVAQRFPDRIVHDGGDVSARLGGRLIGCTVRPDSSAVCTDNAGFRPEEELTIELDAVRDTTLGPTASYRVSRLRQGCFRLRHVGTDFAPRWGDRLDICFDPRTGVAISEVRVGGDLTTTVRRTAIKSPVSDEELSLPATPTPTG